MPSTQRRSLHSDQLDELAALMLASTFTGVGIAVVPHQWS